MAQVQQVTYVDDLTGETVDKSEIRTVKYVWEGVLYEIDVAQASYDKLALAIAPTIEMSRRVGAVKLGSLQQPATGRGRTRGSDARNTKIREWAANNGYNVSERGRLPAQVLEAFEAAS